MNPKTGIRQQILSELEGIRTVDCHSHTHLRKAYYEAGGFDLFSLTSYFERDIASTVGMETGEIYKDARTDEERWQRLKKVLQKSRNVSYWRHNLVVYRELFGLKDPELTDENWREVNETIRRKTQDPSWYDYVTKDLCRLETQVRNVPWFEDWEEEYFTAVLRMEEALELHKESVRRRLESHLNLCLDSLKATKQAIAGLVEEYAGRGAVGIKLAHAYGRTLYSLPATSTACG
ncbi:MAG TPA: hypothetical protein EYP53_06265 [Candidatus Latescibacteria bacterium]|nr:hypothetical protein [Candidatus Latescibacterota bacterium]